MASIYTDSRNDAAVRRKERVNAVCDSDSSSATASPLHRHQASLEDVIRFVSEPPLSSQQREDYHGRLYQIIIHFEEAAENNPKPGQGSEYNRTALVRYTYEYARCQESKDNFLRAFFGTMTHFLENTQDFDLRNDKKLEEDARFALNGFADQLFDNFFLPLQASARKTPQPSPATSSVIEGVGGAYNLAGTQDRIAVLRRDCLTRDHHRCVISRAFDRKVAIDRARKFGQAQARDDDGVLLQGPGIRNDFATLEVAHILPHSLTKGRADSEVVNAQTTMTVCSAANDDQDLTKKAALSILNMFDSGVVPLIDGVDIDRPYNAITLTKELHEVFGSFKIHFEPAQDQEHTYTIDHFPPYFPLMGLALPVTRTLLVTSDRIIDPPKARLLALRSAIGHILHLSAAGDYIDRLFRDMEENDIREDGSTDMARILRLRLEGWLDGTINAH
ncbi:hypothetical protein PT974_10097 [Cladobotryum mycophilum]|uniref:HNH nuclease domain-containing protein n=1 Tax=Cladobotryum mycophilum TaxID=491253 RepID=A0ABR0SAC9_9HYPO